MTNKKKSFAASVNIFFTLLSHYQYINSKKKKKKLTDTLQLSQNVITNISKYL